MKVTYNWLKEFVDIKISPEVLAEKLTMAGLEVVSLEKFSEDYIFEIEITTNRPDWLSVIGIAREVAAITGKKLKLPQLKGTRHKIQGTRHKAPGSRLPLEVKIEDKAGCPRYIGRVFDNIKVKPSPEWMRNRLESVGLRPINNIVDITNYLLFETGQPMHAFDYDKIEEGAIIVRRAKTEEKIITLDAEERTLDNSILVIADKRKTVAVAGIMGGKNSEVSETTKTILLESACFDPALVRKGSKKLALATDSSYRFERGVDLNTVLTASERAAKLIKEFAVSLGAEAGGMLKDAGTKTQKEGKIFLSSEKTSSVLGKKISASEIKKILEGLGFGVSTKAKGNFEVKVPFFRRDVERDVDLIEEIARLSGYENIPLSLPALKEPGAIVREPGERDLKGETKNILLSLGFNEIITHSLISRLFLEKTNFSPDKIAIRVTNPLSAEQEFLRPELTPSMLNTISHNSKRKTEDLRIFELANIYKNEEGKIKEEVSLVLCLTGKRYFDWKRKVEEVDFYDLKGVLETLLLRLGVRDIVFHPEESPLFSRRYSLGLRIKDKELGFMGEINEEILKNFDLGKKIYLATLNLNAVFSFVRKDERYEPVARYPYISRDVSFIIDASVSYDTLLKFFRQDPSELIKEVNLVDVYFGKNIPPGKKSLTISVKFQSPERTLRDEEVEAIDSRLRQGLIKEFAAQPR